MKLIKIQDAKLESKVVLIRVDHNVVKKGIIKDSYRIDASIETIQYIIKNGGKPIVMTHVGRPKNKQTKEIIISENTSVKPIVDYLKKRYDLNFKIAFDNKPNFAENSYLDLLKSGEVDGLYLPNTRWFEGEENDDAEFSQQLADLADIFVNDAFGSWQPHASTVGVTQYLPSFAGLLMQKEIANLENVISAKRPFLAVVAGSKFDTKIGSLTALLESVDHLVIGGVIYNAYLCAKYGVKINGISEEDIKSALEFVKIAEKYPEKIIELPFVVESEILEAKIDGKFKTSAIKDVNGDFVLDTDPKSFQNEEIQTIFQNAETIFVNAVMGFTPNFADGTIELYKTIATNKNAKKYFGGGDTLQEFKLNLPDLFEDAKKDNSFYFFTGGGTILKAIKEKSPFGLEPVKALL